MAKTVASKKAKGIRCEEQWAEVLRETVDPTAHRDPASGAGWRNKSDIRSFNSIPIAYECKNQERWDITSFWEQTCSQAKKEQKSPVLILKRNRSCLFAFMEAELFAQILKYAIKGGWCGELAFPKKTGRRTKKERVEEANLPFSKSRQLKDTK